ncbi:MAG: succinate dehydrogenase cytochrome b subunit [Deltaproteobacteria bacterium]|nr:succinate dehydrogenase cytochrome b subunit [Deltaproteobacteria bacterium]
MSWVKDAFTTSVGKKLLMAVTGLGFLGFLAGHLAGNLTIYWGADAFVAYAEHLHSLEPLVKAAEAGLIVFLVVHAGTGLWLFAQNRAARGGRYARNKWAGGRTVFSATMPYTGVLILVFVAIHLATFKFAPEGENVWEVAAYVFSQPLCFWFYTLSMPVVALHVGHGLWSAVQTLGGNHPKYMPAVRVVSLAAAAVVILGFGLLPTAVSFLAEPIP